MPTTQDLTAPSRPPAPPCAPTVVHYASGRWTLDAWLLAATLLRPDLETELLPEAGDGIRGARRTSRDPGVAAVVAAGLAAGEVHALARAHRVPVLAIPARPLATAGPLVLDAGDCCCLPAAMRCLAATRAVLVTIVDAGGPPLDDAGYAAACDGVVDAVAEARRHGLAGEGVFGVRPDDLLGAARGSAGLIVARDPGAGREAPAVGRALQDRRPVLLVPRAA